MSVPLRLPVVMSVIVFLSVVFSRPVYANLHVGDHLCRGKMTCQRASPVCSCCLSRAPTIVALGLLAEPGEEGLAVGQSQYRGAGLCHGIRVLGGVPLAL